MRFIAAAAALLAAVAVLSLGAGAVSIPVGDTLRAIGHALLPQLVDGPERAWYATILFQGRLPRILLAALTGASLAAAGAVMQGTLRNPLVSPFTLGVSSAASFGAAMAIVYGPALLGPAFYASFGVPGGEVLASDALMVLFSFAAAMASVALVLQLNRRSETSRSTIILGGVVIGYLFQAGVSFAKYTSNDESLRDIALWLMGGTWNISWGTMAILVPVFAVSICLLEAMSFQINTLSAGDDVASNLGVDVRRLRRDSILLSTVMTSSCLAFTGVIGFIGLMAPHICRMIIGNDSRYLLPASALTGAAILLASDTLSRVVIAPSQLPVGIIMYLVGGAFFIWLITRGREGGCRRRSGRRACARATAPGSSSTGWAYPPGPGRS